MLYYFKKYYFMAHRFIAIALNAEAGDMRYRYRHIHRACMRHAAYNQYCHSIVVSQTHSHTSYGLRTDHGGQAKEHCQRHCREMPLSQGLFRIEDGKGVWW